MASGNALTVSGLMGILFSTIAPIAGISESACYVLVESCSPNCRRHQLDSSHLPIRRTHKTAKRRLYDKLQVARGEKKDDALYSVSSYTDQTNRREREKGRRANRKSGSCSCFSTYICP